MRLKWNLLRYRIIGINLYQYSLLLVVLPIFDTCWGSFIAFGGGLFLSHRHNCVTEWVLDVLEPFLKIMLLQLQSYDDTKGLKCCKTFSARDCTLSSISIESNEDEIYWNRQRNWEHRFKHPIIGHIACRRSISWQIFHLQSQPDIIQASLSEEVAGNSIPATIVTLYFLHKVHTTGWQILNGRGVRYRLSDPFPIKPAWMKLGSLIVRICSGCEDALE